MFWEIFSSCLYLLLRENFLVQRKHIILYLERVSPVFACFENNITLNLGRLHNSAQHCWHFACLNCSFSIVRNTFRKTVEACLYTRPALQRLARIRRIQLADFLPCTFARFYTPLAHFLAISSYYIVHILYQCFRSVFPYSNSV